MYKKTGWPGRNGVGVRDTGLGTRLYCIVLPAGGGAIEVEDLPVASELLRTVLISPFSAILSCLMALPKFRRKNSQVCQWWT